jgi:hypothetical protein
LEKRISLLEKIAEADALEGLHLEEVSKQLLTDMIEVLRFESARLSVTGLRRNWGG